MTTAADLTPYHWPVKELTTARVAWICALIGNAQRMTEHLETLPTQARVDLAKQAEVFAATARKLAGIKPPGVRHESIKVPCGRCGHDETVHQYDTASNANQYGDVDPAGRRVCIECKGFCSSVLVPAHVEGWSIEGRGK